MLGFSARRLLVLFNTLAYARFFVVAFVATYCLVDPRLASVLPWLALAATVVFGGATPLGLGLVVLGGLLTWWLVRRATPQFPPTPLAALGSVTINLGLLSVWTYRTWQSDPVTLALGALRLPSADVPALRWVVLAAVAVASVWLLRRVELRILFLVLASYVFYAHWDPRFVPLIWASSTIDFWLGRRIGAATSERSRKRWLVVTVILNLGVLGFFKYYNFGIDSARIVLEELGLVVAPRTLEIALPVGISFFTFESMSYVIDVYRGHIKPHRSYLEYLGFVAFFPHLVAGPIIRPRDLLPQLAVVPRFDAKQASEGLLLIATGLLKKVAISDVLSTNLVDRVFDAPTQYSGLENYVAVVAYALQIYCDFSGYTDIAIGSARLLGIRFPDNFNAPYQATSLQDFWHRWHISLSTWLRDYLYISLGGNRRGRVRTYVNLMLTMLLGGLWHGANWTFVVWGGMHGLGLAATRAVASFRGERPALSDRHFVLRVVSVVLTFHFVCLTWIFFRAETFGKAALILSRIFSGSTYHPNLAPIVLFTLGAGLLLHFIPTAWDRWARARFTELSAPLQALILLAISLVIRKMASTDAVPFVYFQF